MKLFELRQIIRQIIKEESKIYLQKGQEAPKNKKIQTCNNEFK
jgi:hypothetical protein